MDQQLKYTGNWLLVSQVGREQASCHTLADRMQVGVTIHTWQPQIDATWW